MEVKTRSGSGIGRIFSLSLNEAISSKKTSPPKTLTDKNDKIQTLSLPVSDNVDLGCSVASLKESLHQVPVSEVFVQAHDNLGAQQHKEADGFAVENMEKPSKSTSQASYKLCRSSDSGQVVRADALSSRVPAELQNVKGNSSLKEIDLPTGPDKKCPESCHMALSKGESLHRNTRRKKSTPSPQLKASSDSSFTKKVLDEVQPEDRKDSKSKKKHRKGAESKPHGTSVDIAGMKGSRSKQLDRQKVQTEQTSKGHKKDLSDSSLKSRSHRALPLHDSADGKGGRTDMSVCSATHSREPSHRDVWKKDRSHAPRDRRSQKAPAGKFGSRMEKSQQSEKSVVNAVSVGHQTLQNDNRQSDAKKPHFKLGLPPKTLAHLPRLESGHIKSVTENASDSIKSAPEIHCQSTGDYRDTVSEAPLHMLLQERQEAEKDQLKSKDNCDAAVFQQEYHLSSTSGQRKEVVPDVSLDLSKSYTHGLHKAGPAQNVQSVNIAKLRQASVSTKMRGSCRAKSILTQRNLKEELKVDTEKHWTLAKRDIAHGINENGKDSLRLCSHVFTDAENGAKNVLSEIGVDKKAESDCIITSKQTRIEISEKVALEGSSQSMAHQYMSHQLTNFGEKNSKDKTVENKTMNRKLFNSPENKLKECSKDKVPDDHDKVWVKEDESIDDKSLTRFKEPFPLMSVKPRPTSELCDLLKSKKSQPYFVLQVQHFGRSNQSQEDSSLPLTRPRASSLPKYLDNVKKTQERVETSQLHKKPVPNLPLSQNVDLLNCNVSDCADSLTERSKSQKKDLQVSRFLENSKFETAVQEQFNISRPPQVVEQVQDAPVSHSSPKSVGCSAFCQEDWDLEISRIPSNQTVQDQDSTHLYSAENGSLPQICQSKQSCSEEVDACVKVHSVASSIGNEQTDDLNAERISERATLDCSLQKGTYSIKEDNSQSQDFCSSQEDVQHSSTIKSEDHSTMLSSYSSKTSALNKDIQKLSEKSDVKENSKRYVNYQQQDKPNAEFSVDKQGFCCQWQGRDPSERSDSVRSVLGTETGRSDNAGKQGGCVEFGRKHVVSKSKIEHLADFESRLEKSVLHNQKEKCKKKSKFLQHTDKLSSTTGFECASGGISHQYPVRSVHDHGDIVDDKCHDVKKSSGRTSLCESSVDDYTSKDYCAILAKDSNRKAEADTVVDYAKPKDEQYLTEPAVTGLFCKTSSSFGCAADVRKSSKNANGCRDQHEHRSQSGPCHSRPGRFQRRNLATKTSVPVADGNRDQPLSHVEKVVKESVVHKQMIKHDKVRERMRVCKSQAYADPIHSEPRLRQEQFCRDAILSQANANARSVQLPSHPHSDLESQKLEMGSSSDCEIDYHSQSDASYSPQGSNHDKLVQEMQLGSSAPASDFGAHWGTVGSSQCATCQQFYPQCVCNFHPEAGDGQVPTQEQYYQSVYYAWLAYSMAYYGYGFQEPGKDVVGSDNLPFKDSYFPAGLPQQLQTQPPPRPSRQQPASGNSVNPTQGDPASAYDISTDHPACSHATSQNLTRNGDNPSSCGEGHSISIPWHSIQTVSSAQHLLDYVHRQTEESTGRPDISFELIVRTKDKKTVSPSSMQENQISPSDGHMTARDAQYGSSRFDNTVYPQRYPVEEAGYVLPPRKPVYPEVPFLRFRPPVFPPASCIDQNVGNSVYSGRYPGPGPVPMLPAHLPPPIDPFRFAVPTSYANCRSRSASTTVSSNSCENMMVRSSHLVDHSDQLVSSSLRGLPAHEPPPYFDHLSPPLPLQDRLPPLNIPPPPPGLPRPYPSFPDMVTPSGPETSSSEVYPLDSSFDTQGGYASSSSDLDEEDEGMANSSAETYACKDTPLTFAEAQKQRYLQLYKDSGSEDLENVDLSCRQFCKSKSQSAKKRAGTKGQRAVTPTGPSGSQQTATLTGSPESQHASTTPTGPQRESAGQGLFRLLKRRQIPYHSHSRSRRSCPPAIHTSTAGSPSPTPTPPESSLLWGPSMSSLNSSTPYIQTSSSPNACWDKSRAQDASLYDTEFPALSHNAASQTPQFAPLPTQSALSDQPSSFRIVKADGTCKTFFRKKPFLMLDSPVSSRSGDRCTTAYASRLFSDSRLSPVQRWERKARDAFFRTYSTPYIDTHCHIDFLFNREPFSGTFTEYREKKKSTFPANFEGCVAVFCNPKSFTHPDRWKPIVDEPLVWMAMGCHPKSAVDYGEWAEMGLRQALQHKKAVALGEIGLDYSRHYGQHASRQKDVFIRQIKIALEMKLPLVIHCRDAEEDCLAILQEHVPSNYKIHCHCFTGSYDSALKWTSRFPNLFIGLTPLVTFKSATITHEVARHLPLNRLLLETDAPYFIPKGFESEGISTMSHPGMALIVAIKVAELKGVEVEDVLVQVRRNTRLMYSV